MLHSSVCLHPRPITHFLFYSCLVLTMTLASIAVAGSSIQLPPPPGFDDSTDWNQVQYVIVTTTELQPEFFRLADWRADRGTSGTVVTLDWIEDVAPAGADLQETVRNFLILAHDQWQTRYLLIGGDWELLQPRIVRSYFNPMPDGDYVDFPSDWYFGCLDGDWDGDGDGIYGEFSVAGDSPDLEPELAVGRAPVGTAAEAAIFVDKVISHDMAAGENYQDNGLFLGEVIRPDFWQPGDPVQIDGGQYLEDLMPLIDAAQPFFQVSRLYENSDSYAGAGLLNKQSAIDSLASGNFNLVYHMGRGDAGALSLGGYPLAEYLAGEDIPSLVNAPNYFTIMSLAGLTAHGESATLFENMICSAEGAAVAAFGKTADAYILSSRQMGEALLEQLLSLENSRLGDAHKQTLSDFSSLASTSELYHLAVLETVLLGDPAMSFRPEIETYIAGGTPSVQSHVAINASTPNPFNPCTTIHFEIRGDTGLEYDTTLEIFDLTGQRVAVLLSESLEAGIHEKVWNGVDSAGRSVGSGVYFAVVNAAGQSASKKVMLLK